MSVCLCCFSDLDALALLKTLLTYYKLQYVFSELDAYLI
jgi:hypothetical protein